MQVIACVISPNGTLVATTGLDDIIRITNIATRKIVYTLSNCHAVVRTFMPTFVLNF